MLKSLLGAAMTSCPHNSCADSSKADTKFGISFTSRPPSLFASAAAKAFLNSASILEEHDTDKDGKLSLKEIEDDEESEELELLRKAFAAADANSDGGLDVNEIPNFVSAFDESAQEL
jgi:hypothetical protein